VRRAALLVVAACLVLPCAAASGATIPVTITTDVVGADSQCSLREAIKSSWMPGSTDCVPGTAGSDTIQLAAGHYVLSLGPAGEDSNVGGDLDIHSQLTIQGLGAASTTIDANHIDRVIDVTALSGGTTISGVTITGGRPEDGPAATPNTTGAAGATGTGDSGGNGSNGGGIDSSAPLTVENSVITGNRAGDGADGGNGTGGAAVGAGAGGAGVGGAPGDGGSGGGIYSSDALTVTGSSITNNVTGNGGKGGNGIGATGGTSSGTATGGAGGAATGGYGGFAGSGGGLYSHEVTDISNSTFSGNVTGHGGQPGIALGGAGGSAGSNPGTGGHGGAATIPQGGGWGGDGGGFTVDRPITVTGTSVYGNTTGAGASGGLAVGGHGGSGSAVTFGGAGGDATGGDAGFGGASGGINLHNAAATVVNTTVDSNTAGPGGAGGNALGGNGGNGAVATGGAGGSATAGDGAHGGTGGAHVSGTLTHVTVTSNSSGSAGAGGVGTGGTGGTGNPGGGGGSGTNGAPGAAAGAGGVDSSGVMRNSIVASNSAPNCTGVGDGGHDIAFGDATCPGTHADPQLGPRQDNGGPTLTRAIAADGAAHDAVPVSGAGCPPSDQRGIARPQGAACDAGAYELVPASPPGGGGGPGTADTVAPVFASASLSPSTFVVDRKSRAEVAVSARKHRKGTRFRYSLSEAARVVFTVEKRKLRRCGKRKRKRCVRYVRAGRFAHASVAAANVKRFSGRIGRRSLKAGRYRVTLVAGDAAGNKSKPKRLNFRVVRR
jgi:CSLREA domain-containing protein